MVDTSYAERYSTWISRARSQIEAEQWSEAFSGYPFIANTAAPFTPLPRPLAECMIMPITSGGL